jgi:hypothetical protein
MQQKVSDSAHAKSEARSRPRTAKPQHKGRRIPKALMPLVKLAKLMGIKIRSLPWGISVGTVVALLFGIYYQITVALVPMIHPDAAIASSWEDLPITATNRGRFFNLRDARFFCEVTNVTWHAEGKENLVRAITKDPLVFVVDRPPAVIYTGETVTFPCDLSTNAVAQNRYTGKQLPIVLIHMRIRTEYVVNLGILGWKRSSRSQSFTWRQVSGGFQWLEGDSSDAVDPN